MAPLDGIPIYVGKTTGGSTSKEDEGAGYAVIGMMIAAVILWAAYQGVRYLGVAVSYLSKQIPDTVPNSVVYLAIGMIAVVVGRLLFFLRESKRAAYAYLELGSAFGAAVEACTRYGVDTIKTELLFSILGSVYISVRGFDNLKKARDEQIAKNI